MTLSNSEKKKIQKIQNGRFNQHEGHSLSYLNSQSNKRKMKKAFKWILKTLAGETKLGESIHGFLDLMPIPNQPVAKFFSSLVKDDDFQVKQELNKLFSFRNIVAVILFVLISTGAVTMEEVKAVLDSAKSLLELLGV